MLLRHLKIDNFRGIKSLDWRVEQRVACLVGPNDSTKSTILDAIELALWPRAGATVTDTDFHQADVNQLIVIEATFGEVPVELVTEDKFGLYLRGYVPGQGVVDDSPNGGEQVLTIRFSADKELEPAWAVIKTSQPEPKPIGWRDRERLGVTRLGADVERHLTWARGSALARLTAGGVATGRTLAEVARAARDVVANAPMKELNDAAATAKKSAERMGARFTALKPGLDAGGMMVGSSVLGLHEANVPVRLWGLGSKRLTALAIQQSGAGEISVLLIDEIEHGLEPHRIRHLLKRLGEAPDGTKRQKGQVILTTHSPTTLLALSAAELAFVRSTNGATAVEVCAAEFIGEVQSVARSAPHAMLGRKQMVCEGATEVGLCRGLEEFWAAANGGLHPTHIGLVAIDGGGRTKAPKIALGLKKVGYDAVVFADSDEPLDPPAADLNVAGVRTFLWADGVSTEQRLALDLPLASLQNLIDAAVAQFGEELVVQHLCSALNAGLKPPANLAAWIAAGQPEALLRVAIGTAAKNGRTDDGKGWFKNVTLGLKLGEITAKALPAMAGKPTATLLAELMAWVYA